MTLQPQGQKDDAHRVRVLQPSEELERSTTQTLVGTLESAAVLFQAIVLGLSAVIDPYIPLGRVLIASLAIIHLGAAYVISRTAGPFARGGYWVAVWVALAFLVPALSASMIERGFYAINVGGAQGVVYANGPVLIAAFYPWISGSRPIIRWSVEALLLLGLAVEPFILVSIFNGDPQQVNYISAASSVVWLLIAYILGKAVGRMCRVAAQRQIEIQQQSYDEFFNFLHSHVKAGVAAVRAEWGDDAAMREKLSELEQAVSDRRIELLLARQHVPLAALVSERIRAFTGGLKITDSPRVGAVTVPRPVGILVSRALGDLLTNAALYGGDSVAIQLNVDASGLVLVVTDTGRGIDPSVLHDESTSLYRLRHDAEQFGGSLSVTNESAGARLRLFVPMKSTSSRKIRHAYIAR